MQRIPFDLTLLRSGQVHAQCRRTSDSCGRYPRSCQKADLNCPTRRARPRLPWSFALHGCKHGIFFAIVETVGNIGEEKVRRNNWFAYTCETHMAQQGSSQRNNLIPEINQEWKEEEKEKDEGTS